MFVRKLKTLAATAMVVVLVAVAFACSEEKPIAAAPADVAALVKGNNAFALDLYQQLSEEEGNLFLSPYSISAALAMTSAGARGDTLTEMETALHFPPQDKLHPAFRTLIQQMNGDGKQRGYQLSTANALWGQKGYGFLPGFVKLTKDHYGTGLNEVDFAKNTEEARKTINAWVERETQDKIKELLKPGIVTGDSRLVLTNAIYFKGAWNRPFEKAATRESLFSLPDGKKVNVSIMVQDDNFKYYRESDVFQAVELPYAGKDLALLVLLPNKANGLPALERSLTADRLADIVTNMKTERIEVCLPRFKTTTAFQLNKTLQAMGMTKAFADADFSGLDGRGGLSFSAVVHKAFVEVNEEGTEAAAATAAIMNASLPPTFRADHPFLFLIRDTRNGSILFLGRLSDPTK